MRILSTLAVIGVIALGATAPAQAGMMQGGHDCFPKGCHER